MTVSMQLISGRTGRGIPIGRVLGIPLQLNVAVPVLLAFYLVTALSRGVLPVAVSLTLVSLAFGSIFLHELGHALAARHLGYRTLSIELHPFGGLATIEGRQTPRHSVLISLAGPVTNLCLGGVLFGLCFQLPGLWVPFIASMVGSWNLILGAFNLIPVLPLDGGHILESVLVSRARIPLEGSYWSSAIGLRVAILGVLVGVGLSRFLITAIFIFAAVQCYQRFQEISSRLGYAPPLSQVLPELSWRTEKSSPDQKNVKNVVSFRLRELTRLQNEARALGDDDKDPPIN